MTAKRLLEILNTLAPETDILVKGKTAIFNIVGCYTATASRTDCETGEKFQKQVLVIVTDEHKP